MYALQSSEGICRSVGERVRKLRLAHNLTQEELAAMTGVSLSSIKRLEASGQATLRLIAAVALALRSTDGLEPLFAPMTQTIAQIEAASQVSARQRARKSLPRTLSPGVATDDAASTEH